MEIDNLETIKIVSATFPNVEDRNIIIVEYFDEIGQLKGRIINTENDDSDFAKKTLELFPLDVIENNTKILHEDNIKKAQELAQFLEWKETGKITIENPKTDVETFENFSNNFLINLENANNDLLFAVKLTIFDKEEFANFADADLRRQIRKAQSLPELIHHYYTFLKETGNLKVTDDTTENTEETV
jgi:hypothetical protein